MCLNTGTAASVAQTPTTCAGNSGGVSSFICPAGTYSANLNSHSGSTLVAADVANEVVCQAGAVAKSDATTCIAAVAYYGANDATGNTVTYTACPAGLTTDSSVTSGLGLTTFAGCTDLKAGYALSPSVSATSSLSSLGITACAKTNYACAGLAAMFKGSGAASGGITYTGTVLLTSTTGFAGTIASAATGANILASCLSGITTTATTSAALTACTDLAVGWAFNPSLATTNITALLTQCTSRSYGCKGFAGLFVANPTVTNTGISVVTPANHFILASAVATAGAITTDVANNGFLIKGTCPVFATNTFTAASSPTWSWTSSAAAVGDCTDLAPGYGFAPSVGVIGTGVTSTVALLDPCAAGQYGSVCAGSPGLFKSAPVAAVDTVTYTSGLDQASYATNDLILTTPTTFTTAFATTSSGALLISTCPTGSTNAGGAAMTAVSSCIVIPGYYVDPSNLNCVGGCAVCPANEYCLGGGAVGTAGGDTVCPHGSATGVLTPSSLSSSLADCVVSVNFYITTGALATPVACLTGSVCAGGLSVGTAGGSVPCPPNSTLAACTAASAATPGAAGSAGTAGSAGGAGSAGPAGPAGATGSAGPTGASGSAGAPGAAGSQGVAGPPGTAGASASPAAPRAAAHAAVLALTAVAALVAF